MVDISMEVVREQLLGVLREAFEGPAQWSYFADPGPEGGLFGTLARLSAIAHVAYHLGAIRQKIGFGAQD